MLMFDDAFVCESCCDAARQGGDNTSRAVKAEQRSSQLQIDRLTGTGGGDAEFVETASLLMSQELTRTLPPSPTGAGGEAIQGKEGDLVNTLTSPTIAALEASNTRTDLLTMVGTDIAALALDAADTIRADNSIEKMLAHQMAAVHLLSMKMLHRAQLADDLVLATKAASTALQGFKTYQSAIHALHELQGRHRQHIVVQHVSVGAGGQAVVGNVSPQGRAPE